MEPKLGSLEPVWARDMWPNEASDFTPWLAANLSEIGSAIGMELELSATEVRVGPYSADVLATDVATGKYVVIENQLEKTNHDHLGKSITYAAVLGATSIVWIATEFSDEHRKALDWLNDNSSEDVSFFGLRLELWKIGNSEPALRFDIVSQPADYIPYESLSSVQKLRLDFWTQFKDQLASKYDIKTSRKVSSRYYFNVSLKRSGFGLSNVISTAEKRIGVRVYVDPKVAKHAYPQLVDMRDEIDNDLSGLSVEWDPKPNNRSRLISCMRDADVTNRDKWNEYLEWMAETTVRFRDAFRDRVREIDLSGMKANGGSEDQEEEE